VKTSPRTLAPSAQHRHADLFSFNDPMTFAAHKDGPLCAVEDGPSVSDTISIAICDLGSAASGSIGERKRGRRPKPRALAVCLRGGGRSERGPSDTDGVAAVAQAAE